MSTELTVDKVIGTYIKLRAQKEAVEADVKDQLANIKVKMSKLEAWIQAKSDETGVKSFKTDHGTAFMSTSDFASVGDWDAVLSFIKDNDAYDMLNKAVNKKAVREYLDLNGAIPNGVNFGTKISVSVRRPAKSV
jgi:flagellar hook-associated protein FlgK|tara:strand:- start:282 stop:686 length:405 start_codon:yes stop_codon:yes gene_type:complete